MHVHVLLVDLYIYINIRDNVETSQTFTNCTMKERIKCVAAEGPLVESALSPGVKKKTMKFLHAAQYATDSTDISLKSQESSWQEFRD
jgi:hypothetical protein